MDERRLAGANRLDAHRLLQPEYEAGPDRFDDRRRPALLALLDVGEIEVLGRVDVRHRPTAGHRRDAVPEERLAGHQQPGCAGAADELVRRHEDRVDVVPGHVDRDVRRRRGVVPAGERAVRMEEGADPAHVGQDPGDVRCGGERADLERAVRVALQLRGEMAGVDLPVVVLVDHHDVRQGLAPRQLVRVVLVRANEDDRPFGRGNPCAESVAIVEVGREADLQHVHEPVDRARGARAHEDHRVLVGGADRSPDQLARLRPEAAGLEAGSPRGTSASARRPCSRHR